MLSKLKYSLVLLLLLSIATQGSSYQKEETKNILFLFSMGPGLVAYQMFLNNFKDVLREEYSKPYKLFVEYIENERFPDSSYKKYLFERFNEKYNNTNLDLLVIVGPRVVPLVETYASDYIKNLPTISLDIYDPFNKELKYSLHPNTTEILLKIDAKKTLELAFSLFPDYPSAYIISGVNSMDKRFNKIAMIAARDFEKQKNIINLTDLTMEDVLFKVKQISEKSIILVTTFTSDANYVSYNTPEVVRLLSTETSAPIFVLLDTPFDEGAIGGYVASLEKAGSEAGNAAIKYLNGQDAKTIVVDSQNLNHYIFDLRVLKKWNLEDSKFIPAGSIILNKEQDFIGANRWLLSGALLFIILQTLLIVNLVRLNKKQKLTTKKLLETENHYRELTREDRILRMGELTASLSHELNQPLTAIRNSAQAGLRFMSSGKLNSKMMDEILQNIVEDDKRAAEVLSSIRQLMKLEKREKQKIDLNDTIKQVTDIFRAEANIKNIKIQISLSENPVYVLGDRTQIQQVLLNFISNSEHAVAEVDDGNKTINIIEKIENEKVTVTVRDFGIGIDESIKNKLFNPFVTTREEGLGIGLAICKSIIDEHGGKIWAENNRDGGAAVSFQLNLWSDGQDG
jgi:signal transduction histidine kinase